MKFLTVKYVKKFNKDSSNLQTSDAIFEPLDRLIKEILIEAQKKAIKAGRKTVMLCDVQQVVNDSI